MKVDEAVKTLISTYQSLDIVAMGLVVDAAEVDNALAAAEPDSAEGVALRMLAKYNPYTKPDVKNTKQQ
jgi:hypothetical protein